MNTVLFYCTRCAARVQAEVFREWGGVDPDDHHYEESYIVGGCVQCRAPVIMAENCEAGHQREPGEGHTQIYPARRPSLKVGTRLPGRVLESWEEAVKCEAASAWLATAVMVRRTLEAVGRESDATVRSPHKALTALKSAGHISEELFNWGEALRFLGNIGAHPTDENITAEDAHDAMEFLSAIVETMYFLRNRFEDMKRRRSATAGPSEDAS